MYHSLIARKPKTYKQTDDFTNHLERLTCVVDKMVQPNASSEYSDYYIYKDLFDSFTAQLLYLTPTESAGGDDPDPSYNYSEEYKHIFMREKQKPILELLKNKNNI